MVLCRAGWASQTLGGPRCLKAPRDRSGREARYSPAECTGIRKVRVKGQPVTAHVSTSYIERQNLSIRMESRRFMRLKNAFSNKVENHIQALALYFMFYNFVRVHKALRTSPAMAAGVSQTLWTMEEIEEQVEAKRPKAGKRGPYKKHTTE